MVDGPGLVGFQLTAIDGGVTLIGLNPAQESSATDLYSAQAASGEDLFTDLKLYNASPESRRLQVEMRNDDGELVAAAVEIVLDPGEERQAEIGTLFGDVLGTPFRAIKRLKVTAFDTVLITGQGPIGLSATLLCKFLNAFVIVLDINEYRLNHARRHGADVCINPAEESDVLARLQEAAGPEGIDVALDCSASPDAQTLCLDALRRGGRMAFIGVTDQGPRINTIEHFTKKELELIGTWYSSPGDHQELEALMRRGLPAAELITHHFEIEAAPEAFDTFFGGAAMKVMLDPWR